MVSFDMTDQVAIVTGASQGLGKGIALALAQFGTHVVVVAREPEPVTFGRERPHAPLGSVVAEIQQLGRRTLGIVADVREPDQVDELVKRTMETFGRIDILVNNAGGAWGETFRTGPLLEITKHDLEEAVRLNLTSVFLCSRAVAPIMLDQGKGAIVNISAMGGRGPTPGSGAYAAAKAAVINLTQTMAAEWAPKVRVNVLAPGFVETPHRSRGRSEAERNWASRGVALGRAGTPDEYAAAVVYLASDAGAYTTGTVLEVHGGRMSW